MPTVKTRQVIISIKLFLAKIHLEKIRQGQNMLIINQVKAKNLSFQIANLKN
jgi:hypothetical protein